MPEHKHIKVSGRVTDIFAHRFVIETADRRILADLGPKGAELFELRPGLEIIAEGEMKPSELKVERIAAKGSASFVIAHKKPGPPQPHHHDDHPQADPREALAAVERTGLATIGTPRRKPKHFEVLARKDGRLVECHVELDGHIRKEKPVASDDPKWAQDLGAVA